MLRWNRWNRNCFHKYFFEPVLRNTHNKILAATVTWVISAVFHEYELWAAFGRVTGEAGAFFLLHFLLIVGYQLIKWNFPKLCDAIPTPVAIVMNIALMVCTTPLFFRPYINARVYESMLPSSPWPTVADLPVKLYCP